MEQREKWIPCRSREAVVTVRSYRDGVMEGYLQHPRLQGAEKIYSLSQMIILLDCLLDMEGCPNRSMPLVPGECIKDEKCTVFRIQVLFREHHSWQGRLIWENEEREIVFRSVIEFIQLFDEILGE